MAINLTSRQVRCVEWLLDQERPRTIAEIASNLRLSPRMVRTDLDGIERYLHTFEVDVQRRRGLGVWLEAEPDAFLELREAFAALDEHAAIRVFSPDDRLRLALFTLLSAAPDPVTVDTMSRRLEVSLTSARRDMIRVEEWLDSQGLFLARQPGVGMSVIGTESAIRSALMKLLLEAVPSPAIGDWLAGDEWWRVAGVSAGIRDFLRELPLVECHRVVQASETLRAQAEAGHPWLAADLAITVSRIRSGHGLKFEKGAMRSLRDHPVWETAELTAVALRDLAGADLSRHEVAGITEHLLGLVELGTSRDQGSAPADLLVRAAVELAAKELHVGLADDQELIRSLTEHVDRLRVRLQYSLPVHNPLLNDVAARYPDVHDVAKRAAALIEDRIGASVSEDEAGFVTMYLSGALERMRLRPRTRAVVMCPAGVATAWILVSRIQAEFPELDLVEVVSAGSIDADRRFDADVIISTVDIGPRIGEVPVVVVSALLPDEDIRRVSRRL